jgi:hypothetical protein
MGTRSYTAKKLRKYVRQQHRRDFRDFVNELAELPLWRRLAFCFLILWQLPSDPRKRRQWFASREMPDTVPPPRASDDDPDF